MRGANRLRVGLSLFVIGSFLISSRSSFAQVQNVTADFSHYPQAAATSPMNGLQEFVGMHLGDDRFTQNRTAVVAISTMLGGDNAAELESVAPNGREWFVRDVFNWAMQNSGQRQFTPPQLDQLRQAVRDLPEQNSYPDVAHLVIISFRDGPRWVTRCYDQRNPPDALKRIEASIAGARVLGLLEEQAERDAAAKKLIADTRAAMPPGIKPPEMQLNDAISKSTAIFTGTLTNLDGPRDANLGEARYYGTVLLGQTLREPVIHRSVAFGPNNTTEEGMFVAIDARILPNCDENHANIFFGVPLDFNHPRTTVGSDYTILKIVPATEKNLTQVRQLLSPTATSDKSNGP
jgi:hypothetical protein